MADTQERADLRRTFGNWHSALRRGCPQAYWARRFGLSAGAVRDLEQARVLPSRAMVVLMQAIEMDRDFMGKAAKAAADRLADLDRMRDDTRQIADRP